MYYLKSEDQMYEKEDEEADDSEKLLVFKDLDGKLWQISPVEETVEKELNEIITDEDFGEDENAAAAAAAARED